MSGNGEGKCTDDLYRSPAPVRLHNYTIVIMQYDDVPAMRDMAEWDFPTAVLAPLGGVVVPVDKLALLAPYIGFASTILVGAVASAIYVKRGKRRKEKQ
jgi:hypothetical protein